MADTLKVKHRSDISTSTIQARNKANEALVLIREARAKVLGLSTMQSAEGQPKKDFSEQLKQIDDSIDCLMRAVKSLHDAEKY